VSLCFIEVMLTAYLRGEEERRKRGEEERRKRGV